MFIEHDHKTGRYVLQITLPTGEHLRLDGPDLRQLHTTAIYIVEGLPGSRMGKGDTLTRLDHLCADMSRRFDPDTRII